MIDVDKDNLLTLATLLEAEDISITTEDARVSAVWRIYNKLVAQREAELAANPALSKDLLNEEWRTKLITAGVTQAAVNILYIAGVLWDVKAMTDAQLLAVKGFYITHLTSLRKVLPAP